MKAFADSRVEGLLAKEGAGDFNPRAELEAIKQLEQEKRMDTLLNDFFWTNIRKRLTSTSLKLSLRESYQVVAIVEEESPFGDLFGMLLGASDKSRMPGMSEMRSPFGSGGLGDLDELNMLLSMTPGGSRTGASHDCATCPDYDECDSPIKTPRGTKVA
jgi:hypothetical protein